MSRQTVKLVFGVVLIFVLTLNPLLAQEASATLLGKVTDHAGRVLPDVKVSVKNRTTGQSAETQTTSGGLYAISNLAPAEYEVSVASVDGAKTTQQVTLRAGDSQTLDLVLDVVGNPTTLPAETLPNAPSSSKTEPSLEDLGFSRAETQSNAAQQALLDKRTHMLKIHQRMGLITTIPLLATLVTSVNASGKSTGTASRDLHVALGAVTGDLYGITAWYAIRAPKIAGTETRGPIRFHKAMAWIHGPGMILTPILGAMAFNQKSNGEKVHGIAAAHGAVAIVTAGAFGAALLSVSVKF
jgi:hypothetical protein